MHLPFLPIPNVSPSPIDGHPVHSSSPRVLLSGINCAEVETNDFSLREIVGAFIELYSKAKGKTRGEVHNVNQTGQADRPRLAFHAAPPPPSHTLERQ
jgi:hypothetical protein